VSEHAVIVWVAFLAASSLAGLVFLLVGGRKDRLDQRLDDLTGIGGTNPERDVVASFARSALPKIGAPLVPKDEEERTRLQARLIHAGYYSRQAMVVFFGVKVLLMVGPAFLGLALGAIGLVPISYGLFGGALLGAFGMVGPSFWLDNRKAARQASLRRALPDALDVLVICLEGGLSLPGAIKRVAGELRTAHPGLATELNIVQREVQLGRSTGEALREFAARTDLEEIRSLASVVVQAERYGASLVKALRVHSESLRDKRLHYAEEMGQKAAIKVLFPTILCIFPGMFIVMLGPAVIKTLEMFASFNR
jgi:tight adherence protein C